MRINATKTKEMVICFCRNGNHVASIPRIVINNNNIERVTQAKVLGVTLSSDLKVPLHDTIHSCGVLRLPCTSANRNVWRVSRMFRADENRMTWH